MCTATRTYRVASRYHQRHVGPKRNAQDIRAENRMGGCRGAAHRELGRCRRIAIGISSVVGVRWTRAQLPAAPRRGEDAPRTLGRQKTSEKDKPRAGAASPGREAGETWNVFWGRSLSTKSSSATPVGGDGAEGCKHGTRARTLSQGGCGRVSVRPEVCSQPEPQKQ